MVEKEQEVSNSFSDRGFKACGVYYPTAVLGFGSLGQQRVPPAVGCARASPAARPRWHTPPGPPECPEGVLEGFPHRWQGWGLGAEATRYESTTALQNRRGHGPKVCCPSSDALATTAPDADSC